jgi:quercetin 2,3-dioxygenase
MTRSTRKVRSTFRSRPTLEGAGVRLKRAFGHPQLPLFDPFLLLDDFHSADPEDYLAGFPWHPHRGIETITYVLSGTVHHKDSMGNHGAIGAGDVQWMTAGSGIIHEEMPQRSEPELWGFQLWANLPASHKMMDPRYRDIRHEQIPFVRHDEKVGIRIICGTVAGVRGPVGDVVTDPEYLDITLEPNATYDHPVEEGHTVFCYVIEGAGSFSPEGAATAGPETVVLFDDGGSVRVGTAEKRVRFLMVSGRPIREPVSWYGPIVMNSREETERAFEEYRNGTFIKKR